MSQLHYTKHFNDSQAKTFDIIQLFCNTSDMNIVEQAAARVGSQLKLAERLASITHHPYKPGHVSYWIKNGRFPADLANVVASEIFAGEITAYEACPSIKRVVRG